MQRPIIPTNKSVRSLRQVLATLVKTSLCLTACVLIQTLPAKAYAKADKRLEDFTRVEMENPTAIRVRHASVDQRSLKLEDYQLSTADGDPIELAAILASSASDILLIPIQPLQKHRVHYLKIAGIQQIKRVRFDGWFRNLYSHKSLGAEVDEEAETTTFGLFAPRANEVTLFLYRDSKSAAYKEIKMDASPDGVWVVQEPKDLHGTYYDFRVDGDIDPGNHFFKSQPVNLSDPYARVYDDRSGRSRVWRKTQPATPLKNGRPAMQDVVAYEVHVQDFTDLLPSEHPGTLLAMTESGLKNSSGKSIGFDYLLELGINVVHLMPVQEYLHYPDQQWAAAFAEDEEMQRLGVATENYQWGYRTTHAMAIEDRFRAGDQPGKPLNHGAQRDQFRDLVQKFHDHNIAVIIDIVPNHTGEDMDGQARFINFNGIDKHYYYRLDDAGEHIGEYGNEVKTEDRPMVQRWIIDQCLNLIEEFGIDGFRIDLAGQIDEQTLRALMEALPEDIILYGEPWIDVKDPWIKANPDWDWYKEDSPITFFQDSSRDAIIGRPFTLQDPVSDRGFAGGDASQRSAVVAAISNDYPEESESNLQGINYIDIHDNWALADKFAYPSWNGLETVEAKRIYIASGLLLTSLGPIVLHGGSEIMRSKGIAPIEDQPRETDFGTIYFKGRDDTYNMRTPNQFVWETVGTSASESSSNDYQKMFNWWQGLIKLRLSTLGQPLRRAAKAGADYFRWYQPENPHLLAYSIDDSILVAVNVGETAGTFDELKYPGEQWRLLADNGQINLSEGLSPEQGSAQGGAQANANKKGDKLLLPPLSIRIWIHQ